jgi:hypothetical protein
VGWCAQYCPDGARNSAEHSQCGRTLFGDASSFALGHLRFQVKHSKSNARALNKFGQQNVQQSRRKNL